MCDTMRYIVLLYKYLIKLLYIWMYIGGVLVPAALPQAHRERAGQRVAGKWGRARYFVQSRYQ